MAAIIWCTIVAVWGCVLVPMWLRRHDTGPDTRSVARFSSALKARSRGRDEQEDVDADLISAPVDAATGTMAVPQHPEEAQKAEEVAAMTEDLADTRPPAPPDMASSGRGHPSSRVRRTRVLAVLGTVAVLTFMISVVAPAVWPVHLVADITLVVYLVRLRRLALQEQRYRAQRVRRAQRLADAMARLEASHDEEREASPVAAEAASYGSDAGAEQEPVYVSSVYGPNGVAWDEYGQAEQAEPVSSPWRRASASTGATARGPWSTRAAADEAAADEYEQEEDTAAAEPTVVHLYGPQPIHVRLLPSAEEYDGVSDMPTQEIPHVAAG